MDSLHVASNNGNKKTFGEFLEQQRAKKKESEEIKRKKYIWAYRHETNNKEKKQLERTKGRKTEETNAFTLWPGNNNRLQKYGLERKQRR